MKKEQKYFVILSLIILISAGCILGVALMKKVRYNQDTALTNVEENNELINITECSEEFMEDYFETSKEINEKNNKDNILIVTSKEKIKNIYGASDIVEAPNNQYILQYASEVEKNNALNNLKNDATIISVEENIIYTIEETEYNSWGIQKMSLDYAISTCKEKELNNTTVAIIDTGCNMQLFNEKYPEKIAETYNVLQPDGEMTDENGHGTHVAGTIAEGTPANVKILPIKVTKSSKMYNTDIIEAINYIAYYDKADVINMSFGSYGYSEAIEQAIEAANQKNIISVAAAGNDNTSANHYPSALDNTISIAAVDSNLNKASFSNYGAKTTFTAPGVDILSLNGTMSGTSMATPHAVSAVAILKSFNENITLDDTIELLKSHAIDLGNTGWDQYYGYGLISFVGAQFCDGPGCEGTACDEYHIFKQKSESTVQKIEIPMPILTSYNYGTINNLLSTKMRLYYTDELYDSKELWELDGLEITGYDAYSSEEQTVQVKYSGLTTSFTITNPSTYESGWEYTIIDENNIELTLYKDSRTDIDILYIPEMIDGYNVVSLAGNSELMSKVFGNSVDFYAFEEIILPKTLTQLGRASLMGSSVKKVISLADNISLGEYAFLNVSTLTTFEGIISELGNSVFSGCSSLDNITLIDTMTYIPECAFLSCSNLEDINIPSKLTSIGAHAFESTKIKEFVIPSGVTKIEEQAFSYCYNLESVTIPETVIEIETGAFYNSNIRELFIPKSVVNIGSTAFAYCSSLESIEVDEDNTVYDSRDNCNAIIETGTNTLIVGTGNTIIPSTITTIGTYAFVYNLGLEEITIPNSVTEIQAYAFYGCDYLEKVIIPRSVTTIGENAFKYNSIIYRNDGTRIEKTFWLYSDSYAKTYAVENKIAYEALDISYVLVDLANEEYSAFDTVKTEDILSIKLYYDRGKYVNDTYKEYTKVIGREEIITDGYTIKYMNDNDGFRYGDTYFTISGISENGEVFEKQIDVTVNKLVPIYKVPENLTAQSGTKLSEIFLPDGFEWMDETQIIEGFGNLIYKAKYIPKDTTNYETIENIEIIINVISTNISDVTVYVAKKEYKAFETVDMQDMYIMVTYEDGRTEYIKDNITIQYLGGNDSFRYGDTSFAVNTFNETGTYIGRSVYVTVLKAAPEYTIPTNITANIGQQLVDIELPEGFEWMDDTQKLTESGNKICYARFTPTDTDNYEIVENIEIIVNVKEIKVEKIVLDKINLVFNTLEEQKITATIIPENATNKNVIWTSTNPNVAKVNVSGAVQPISDGTCEIICAAKTDPENVIARCTVVVNNSLQATISKIYNDDNTVTVKVVSKYPFEDTKPTWTLSEDKITYTKTYNTNGTYSTVFVDRYAHTKTLTFTIDEIESKYNTIKIYDANTNTVAVSVINNFGMQQTKPTWDLSLDQKTYTKVYDTNGTYTTTFVDAQGITTPITFTVNEIDKEAPNLSTSMTYDSDKNTVIVEVTSDEVLGETKPTWTLSEDRKAYTKVYNTNGTYTTMFKDICGNEKSLTFIVSEIESKYQVIKIYDKTTNTVTVSVVNNFGMQQTKPTWNLSLDQKTYTKVYDTNGTYTTTFVDAQGITTPITFTVNEIDKEAPNLSTSMTYDSDENTVTVEVTSDEVLGETKPTWTLSEDRKTYTKVYNTNGTYTTMFKDICGNEKSLTFTVSEIESKYQVIKIYDKTTNTVTVSVVNNFRMLQTKPTWSLSADKRVYSKLYSVNGTYTTTFIDINGIEKSLTFTINEI